MSYRNLQIVLIIILVLFTITVSAQSLNVKVLQTMIDRHSNHDSKLSKSISHYLDTCSIKNNFSTEEFLQFISESESTNPFQLLDADMTSIFTSVGFYLSYSSVDWYKDNYELFIENEINRYLLFTKNRKEQESKKSCKLRFGYFIFEKDKTIYCLMRIVEI